VLDGYVRRSFDLERHLPGEHLVEDDAQRVEVARSSHPLSRRLLGGHILRAAKDVSEIGDRGRLGGPSYAEVRDLDVTRVGDKDVAWLDVPVDDASLVGCL
jgi:hypothetical protein